MECSFAFLTEKKIIYTSRKLKP